MPEIPAHPEPPDDLHEHELPTVRHAGPFFRSYNVRYDPVFFGRSGWGRFDDPEKRFGVLYAGLDPYCAFIETFGHSTGEPRIVTWEALKGRGLAQIELERQLLLVDLTGSGLARLGADERLAAADYRVAQRWSRALYLHPEAPDGLLYRARHDPSRLSVALFDRVEADLAILVRGSFAEPSNRHLLGQLLEEYDFALVEAV